MSSDQDLRTLIRDVCASVKFDPFTEFFWPGEQGYINSTNSYFWSSSKQSPRVVFQPASANDIVVVIQRIIKVLNLPFAIKAASHIAPFGFNSSQGMLIDMIRFKDIKYNAEEQTVDVGPGLQWTAIYDYFTSNKIPRNVNGATSCQGVGVAGFLLGGGYGNKANRFGLAMDNICAMEVITPQGDIVAVTEPPTPGSLSWALRGGGNNFGIVTKWTLATHEQPAKIYFFRHVYEQDVFDQVEKAVWNFAQKVDNNRKANVETKFEWTINDGNLQAFAFAECYYDGIPPEDLFKEFNDIPQLPQLKRGAEDFPHFIGMLPTRRQTYRWGVVLGQEDLPEIFRGRYTCVMLSKFTPPLIQKIVEVARTYAKFLPEHSGLQLYPDLWPASSKIFENSPPCGWPHDKDHPNFPLPIRCIWTAEDDDGFWLDALNNMTTEIRNAAIEQKCTTADTPVYYNLALDGTCVETIYRENYLLLKETRQKFDPENFMGLTGGFRIV